MRSVTSRPRSLRRFWTAAHEVAHDALLHELLGELGVQRHGEGALVDHLEVFLLDPLDLHAVGRERRTSGPRGRASRVAPASSAWMSRPRSARCARPRPSCPCPAACRACGSWPWPCTRRARPRCRGRPRCLTLSSSVMSSSISREDRALLGVAGDQVQRRQRLADLQRRTRCAGLRPMRHGASCQRHPALQPQVAAGRVVRG